MHSNAFAQAPGSRRQALASDRQATGQRFGWRAVLGAILGAPVRIHRYRDLHSRMVRDLLCHLDCGASTSDPQA